MMFTVRSTLAAVVLALCLLTSVDAAPQNRKKGNKAGATKQLTSQEQAAQIPGGISQATDGSTILDSTVTVKYASFFPCLTKSVY